MKRPIRTIHVPILVGLKCPRCFAGITGQAKLEVFGPRKRELSITGNCLQPDHQAVVNFGGRLDDLVTEVLRSTMILAERSKAAKRRKRPSRIDHQLIISNMWRPFEEVLRQYDQ